MAFSGEDQLSPRSRLPKRTKSTPVVANKFADSRWIGGTWDLKQFRKDGSTTTTDWDAVIDARNCSVLYGELLNLKEVAQNGKTIYLKLAASEFSNMKDSINGVVIGAVVRSIIFLAIVGLIVLIVLRRRNRLVKPKAVEGSLMAFTYRDMQNATRNFSGKLGGGGFGNVFKGVVADSTAIAVKKLESISQGENQSRTEVSTIGTIQHVNPV
ncbi:G-type lectin S-receptor-like serine/threonine-protein kinase At2g19130 [Linum perenne]